MTDWLSKIREKGKRDYAKSEWPRQADSPTQQNYTANKDFNPRNFQGHAETRISFKTSGEVEVYALDELKGNKLARYAKKRGKIIPSAEHIMLSFKDSALENGFFIHAPEKSQGSVEITCESQGAVGMHGLVLLEKNARLSLYQKQEGEKTMVAEATEVFCGENSSLTFDYTQETGFQSSIYTAKRAILQKNAKLVWNTAFFGGKTTIATIDSKLSGEGADAQNYNSYFGSGSQSFDISTNSYHYPQNTSGNVLSKGVLTGEAQSTYRGLIHIAKTGRQTNCFLNGHALLLGEKARANSVPSLEIFTNDVQSRHGATVDQIDGEKLFYLNSRGFNNKQAVELIVKGFVGEVFSKTQGNAAGDWEKILSERMKHA